MTGPDWQRPDPALATLRTGLALALGAVPAAVAVAVAAALGGAVPALAVAAAALLLLALLVRAVRRSVAAWGWLERDDDLLLQRGVLVHRTTVVPYGRMQYVDVTAGPLDRRFGLSRVVLHTAAAATDAAVPGLRAEDAARLRDRLAALGEARAAGV